MRQEIIWVRERPCLDRGIIEHLQEQLGDFAVEEESRRARARLLQEPFALVVLEGVTGGLAFCRGVRGLHGGMIMWLAAHPREHEHIQALEAGVDDYVALPVGPGLLLARIRALLRRTSLLLPADRVLRFGNLEIDARQREARLGGAGLDLTAAEFDLLWLLAVHAGEVLSREEISSSLRGIEYDGQDRSIDVRISRIRPRLGDDPLRPQVIKTLRNRGYLFVAEAAGRLSGADAESPGMATTL